MLKYIRASDLAATEKEALTGVRGRAMFVIHTDMNDPLHRMVNIMTPRTYVQPHKHENPDKREVFVCLKGKVAVVEFDNAGNITSHAILQANGPVFAVEIPPRTWHTFICLANPTHLFEVKDGPWNKATDKNFAPFAPGEDTIKEAQAYNEALRKKLGVKND